MTTAEPTRPTQGQAWPERKPRRASWPERLAILSLGLGLALFFVDYVLGGAQGAGYAWFEMRRSLLAFLAWQIHVYVLALVPIVAVSGYISHNALPIIDGPLLGAGDQEARRMRVWYWPGTLRIIDDEATWREGKSRAFINKAFLDKRGMFGYTIRVPVERNVDPVAGEVTYDPAEVPAYRSRTLERRLQIEVQQRIIEDHKRRLGGSP